MKNHCLFDDELDYQSIIQFLIHSPSELFVGNLVFNLII